MFESIRSLFKAKPQQEETLSLEERYSSLKEKHCIELKITDWIKEGKVSEPVISFSDTVVNDPGRFKVKEMVYLPSYMPYSRERSNVLIDKITGKRFDFVIRFGEIVGHFTEEGHWIRRNGYHTALSCEDILQLKVEDSKIYVRESDRIFSQLLLTKEEELYVACKVIPALREYYGSRQDRLTEIKQQRKSRAILKEREALKKIYCK